MGVWLTNDNVCGLYHELSINCSLIIRSTSDIVSTVYYNSLYDVLC